MSGFYVELMNKADYTHSNHLEFITLNEFIYLAAGYEPLPAGIGGFGYVNSPSQSFIDFYKKVKRHGEDLTKITTKDTEVRWNNITGEEKYEAGYLVEWARSKNIPINEFYKPVLSGRRKEDLLPYDALTTVSEVGQILPKNEPPVNTSIVCSEPAATKIAPDDQITDLEMELLLNIKSSKIYEPLFWIYEKYYKDKKSVQLVKVVLPEIKKKYNLEENKYSDQIYLTANECELLNSILRMVFDIKKT